MASDPLGKDLWVGPVPGGGVDMTRSGRSATGLELAINGIVARSMADTISMIGAPGGRVPFGKDVRAWVGGAVTEATAGARAQELAVVYARDPRLDPGAITVAIDARRRADRYAFTIAVNARTTTALPIAVLLGVSDISVDVLANAAAQGA